MAPISIYIANFSFEAPIVAEGGYRLGVGPEWMEWMPEAHDFPNGIQRPAAGFFAVPVADGAQLAFIHTGQIFQWTGETVQPNARYTLEVDVYARLDVGPGLTWPGCEINLYANKPAAGISGSLGMARIPATGPDALAPGHMRTVTVVVDVAAHDPLVGAEVAVVLINLTNQVQLNVDNVRLTRDAVPTGIIPISNFSFERNAVAEGQVANDVQGWIIGDLDGPAQIGVWSPEPDSGVLPTHGNQVLWMNRGTLSQWLPTALIQVDTVYTLKVDYQAHPVVGDPGITIQLIANQQAPVSLVALSHQPGTLAPGQATTLTLTYTALAGDPNLGQALDIVFYSTGTPQILVDNVRLTYAAVVSGPVITDVTRPQSGVSGTQDLTITGTDFPDSPSITILGPDTQPISITVQSASSTQIVVRGVFAAQGNYTVTVNGSDPFVVQALPPIGPAPTITSVTRPIAAQGSQSVTITGTDFPAPPSVTITGPDAQPITLSVISATATNITVTGIFPLPGTYQVVVSGSAPFAVESAPPSIASVVPSLVSGWAATQTITIIGSGFHPNPTVTLLNPDGTSRSIGVVSSSPNAILASVGFAAPGPPGTYTLTVDDSPPYGVVSVPRPVITGIDPIYHGITETQDIVIHGTGFVAGQLVQIRDPQNQLINVRILSVTPTAITVRGTFFQPGDYTFHVWVADPVTVTSIAKPATITYTGPIYDDRSPVGSVGGAFTIGGFGFTAALNPQTPPLPVITFTDPNGQPVNYDFATSQDTWVALVLHPPLPPGEYTISVDGSPVWRQQSIPFIGYASVTAVDPAPQAGTYDDQYLTLTGENFPTEAPPSVIVSDPGGQSVTVTVIPPWTSTSVTIRGVFYANGLWGFRIGQGGIFYIQSIPPVGPVAMISAVTRPATGSNAEQYLTIQGTLFETPPTVRIVDPNGHTVPFTLLFGSTTTAVVSGVFNQLGTWTVYVDNSPPFTVEALPEPATITAVDRPQAALTTPQLITITGAGFTGDPVVTVTGPSGQPIDIVIVSSTDTTITISVPPDLPEGVYNVTADGSPPYGVLALPIPIPTLTGATAIQSGLTATQTVTLFGTWMRDPVSMTCVGPQGPVPVTVISSTREQVEVSGVFLYPGAYTFTVTADGRSSLPLTVNALPPAPPVITDIQPRPQAGLATPQTLTLQTTGFLTGPLVTVTGPDGLPVPVSVVSAPMAPLGGPVTVSGVFWLEGTYTFTVDGSQPYDVLAVPIPRITAVQQPQAGESAPQTITITGTDFPAGSTVTVIDPNSQPITVTVNSVTPTSIDVTGVFYWPGTYTFRAGLNPLSTNFSVEALTPVPVITGVTRPQAGDENPQQLTITGLWFPDPATVTVSGPSGPIEVSIVSRTDTAIVVSGVFAEEGEYTFTVDTSAPFTVEAIPIPPPPPPVITSVVPPPQWGTQKTQYLTINGDLFRPDSVVTVHAPAGPDVPITIVDITPTAIRISGVFEREGIYAFQVDDSNIFYVEATPPPPPPFITDVTPPQYGTNALQTVKITGTNFPGVDPDSQLIVHVIGPDGEPVDVTVISNTRDTIIIWGRFPLEGAYTFQVSDGEVFSNVFSVETVAPPTPPTVYSYPIRRVREFQLPSSPDQRRMFISRLELEMRTGIGKLHDPGPGSGMDPQVMMQLSRDGGKTWGPEQWRHAGNMGDYLRRVRWLRQGYYRHAVLRLAFSVPVPWQLTSLSGDIKVGSN